MALRLNNSFFRLDNGVFRSVEPNTIILQMGQVFRVASVGGTGGSLSYTKIDGSSATTSTLTTGQVEYILAVSGSLSDSYNNPFGPGQLAVINLLITSSVNETPTFTEQIITTTGAGTFTKPVGVTEVIVECWGGGGAGGGATSNPAAGAGGAAGQYSRKYIQYSSPSIGIPYSVAATRAGTQNAGTVGNDTTWNTNIVVAKGGAGGGGDGVPGAEVAGGVGSITGGIGDVVYAGNSGFPSNAGNPLNQGGSGGSHKGSTGTGDGFAGQEYGGSSGAAAAFISENGGPGGNYGAGGGGAYTNVSTNRLGGNGAQGLIRIIYKTDINQGIILNLNAENASSYPGTGTTWSDLSGNGYNATMSGTVPFVNTSPKYFNYVDTPNFFIGNSNITASISDKITIISWIKVTDLTKRSVMFDKYQLGFPNGYGFEVGTVPGLWTNTLRFFAVGSTGEGWDPRGVSNAIQENIIYMISATLDRTLQQSSLYVNGSSIAFTQGGGTLAQLATDWSQAPNNYTIGSFRPEEAVDSSMQQYRLTVYNRFLSSTEITNVFNAQKGLYGL